jgi:hypothetical protein
MIFIAPFIFILSACYADIALIISYCVMISIFPLSSSNQHGNVILVDHCRYLVYRGIQVNKGNGAVEMLLTGCDLMPGFSNQRGPVYRFR